jgi:hypothetical protein
MANPTKSGWYTNTILAALAATTQTGGILNIGQATNKVSLLTYSTSSDGASPIQFQTTTQAWVNTFEATGTGWVTTGITLATAATGSTSVTPSLVLTGSSPYSVSYEWANPLSVSGTTLTGVGGMIIYADPLSAPIVKPMILYINFGAAYSTVAGVFGVTPASNILSTLTVTQ